MQVANMSVDFGNLGYLKSIFSSFVNTGDNSVSIMTIVEIGQYLKGINRIIEMKPTPGRCQSGFHPKPSSCWLGAGFNLDLCL
jgi:hypothetical protein